MGQVTVTLNGRTYRLTCGDGEEARLEILAAHLKTKVDTLAIEFGQIGEERLLLMAGLLVTDELFDARERSTAVGKVEPVGLKAPTAGQSSTEVNSARSQIEEHQPLASRASVPASATLPPGKSLQSNNGGRKPGRN